MATEVTAKVEHDYHGMGSIPQYAVKLDGYVGLSSAASETVANYTVSPFAEDMIILAAYMCVTTVSATGSADFDIGIADDADGSNNGDELFDAITTYSTLGVYEGLATEAVTGGARPIWKATGSTTDSYIVAQQNGNVDASDLVYNLVLVVAPYAKFKAT
jgi:hypothetical protein